MTILTIPPLAGERPKTYRPGRVCSTCSTELSIYNSRHRCAQCDPLPQILGKREHHDAWSDLADLMENVDA